MDDTVPRLIGLLLAGLVALMSLQATLGDTPRGRSTFRIVLVVFLAVIVFAGIALLRNRAPIRPLPDAPTTVAQIVIPDAPKA